MLIVYTDGSSKNGLDHYAGAFAVYDSSGHDKIVSYSGIGTKAIKMRNIAGELSAVMHATRWLFKNNQKGCIYHDYIGISKWVIGEWQANNEFTQAYVRYMRPFYEKGIVSFKWVKGHSGNLHNDVVDSLARYTLMNSIEWSDK